MKILVPVDGSDFTRRALEHLAAQPEWFAPSHRYTMLHVAPLLPGRAAAVISHEALQRHHEEDAEAVFAPVRGFFAGRGLDAEYRHRVGHPADEIAATARDDGHDLIIMGSHGHGALAGLLLGSVTTKVIAKTTVPVLIVR